MPAPGGLCSQARQTGRRGPDCRPSAYEAYGACTRPNIAPLSCCAGQSLRHCHHLPKRTDIPISKANLHPPGRGPGPQMGPTRPGWALAARRAQTRCGVRAWAAGRFWALGVPVSWAARLALFAHLPPAPGRAVSRAVGKGPCGPAGGCGAARPPLRPSLAAPPLPRFLSPRPCAPFVPPWAWGGPPGGVRAGGLVPARPFSWCGCCRAAAGGGAAAGPQAASGPGAPGPAPRRGLWAALFSRGPGQFCWGAVAVGRVSCRLVRRRR